MTRLQKFNSFKEHVVQGRLFKQLKKEDILNCIEFINENDKLSKEEFTLKVNRWLLDQPKPKKFPIMWSLVLQSNCAKES